MHIYSIYRAINKVNGKCYIGFDSKWPKRQIAHKTQSFNGKVREYNYYFHRAIRKYGWDNFEWEIIYQSLDGNHCLNEMEKHFIQTYNSFSDGYNMTLGGEGSPGIIRTEKQKINNGAKRPEVRQILREQKLGNKNPMFGKKGIMHHFYGKKNPKSEETIEKLKGRIPWNKGLNKSRLEKVCPTCDAIFYVLKSEIKRKFCSKRCANLGDNNPKRKSLSVMKESTD